MKALSSHIEVFFRDYLPKQRGCSSHTCETYSFAFLKLFNFAASHLKISPSQILLQQLDASLVTTFLIDLEITYGCSIRTRNARLAAIKSFFHFLEYRVPSALEQIRQVLAIPYKKTETKVVPFLSKKECDAILAIPDLASRMGNRDYTMIHLAMATGLRVSELLGLTIQDLKLQSEPCILVHGKRRKERVLPLWQETARCLRKWLHVRGSRQGSL